MVRPIEEEEKGSEREEAEEEAEAKKKKKLAQASSVFAEAEKFMLRGAQLKDCGYKQHFGSNLPRFEARRNVHSGTTADIGL